MQNLILTLSSLLINACLIWVAIYTIIILDLYEPVTHAFEQLP